MAQRIDAISKYVGHTLKYAKECTCIRSTMFTCVHVVIQPISSCFFCCCCCCLAKLQSMRFKFEHSFPCIFLRILFFCHTKTKLNELKKKWKKYMTRTHKIHRISPVSTTKHNRFTRIDSFEMNGFFSGISLFR